MEENVILQIILHEENGVEVHLNNSEKINPLILIGILEQVKMNLLNDAHIEEVSPKSNTKTYDA